MLFVGVKLGGHNLFSFLFFLGGMGHSHCQSGHKRLGGGWGGRGAEVREVSGFLF